MAEQAQQQQPRGLIDQVTKNQLGIMYDTLQQQYTNLQTNFNLSQANVAELQEQLAKYEEDKPKKEGK